VKLLAALMLVLVPFTVPAFAQAPGEPPSTTTPEPKASISLADATAPPNWELRIPVSLKLAAGTEVGRVTARIVYRPEVLKFESIQRSDTLGKAGLDVKVEPLKDSAEPGTASLRLEVPAASGGVKVPAAVLGILVFRVMDEAKEGTTPITVMDVRAWAPGGGSAPVVEAGPGPVATVTIAPGGLPIFACFFYMH
jgi:hypothetical protein